MNSQTELGVGWGVKTGGLAGNQTQILLQLNRKENVLPPESSSSQSSQWNFRGSSRKFIRRSFFYAVIFIPSQTTACCCCYHLFFCIFFWLRLCWAWISPEATWFFTQALSRMTHVTQETPRREPRPGGTFIPEHHGKSLIKLRQSPNQGWGHKDPREMLQACSKHFQRVENSGRIPERRTTVQQARTIMGYMPLMLTDRHQT